MIILQLINRKRIFGECTPWLKLYKNLKVRYYPKVIKLVHYQNIMTRNISHTQISSI